MKNNDILDNYDKAPNSKKQWLLIFFIAFLLILGILFNLLFDSQKANTVPAIQQPIPINVDEIPNQ